MVMNCDQLRTTIMGYIVNNMLFQKSNEACRVQLPLLAANGDNISIYVESNNETYIIHDGGHITGLLFQSSPSGASSADKRVIDSLIDKAGFAMHHTRGIVFVEAREEAIPYWCLEMARTIAIAGAMIPTTIFPKRRTWKLGPLTISKVIQELLHADVMSAIHASVNIRGITHRRTVDLTYTLPKAPLRPNELQVFILGLDLDTRDPVEKVNRGITTASDLSMVDGSEPKIRIVYGVPNREGLVKKERQEVESAERLLEVVSKKDLLEPYCWDKEKERTQFLDIVKSEVSLLLMTSNH